MPHFDFAHLVYAVSRTFRQRFNEVVGESDLNLSQWRALSHLAKNDMCRQVDLANLLEIKPITLARVLDTLESQGLVSRLSDKLDRRVFRLTLTSDAAPVMEKIESILDTLEEEALEVLTDSEKKTLIKLLLKVNK